MALDPKKRQKKLLKKAEKRREKKVQIHSNKLEGSSDNIANLPIHECLVPKNIHEVGIGNISFSRKTHSGQIATSSFLVDVYCLGVKNAFFNKLTNTEYQNLKNKDEVPTKSVTPSYIRKLVEGSVEFASKIGFKPHKDYAKASKIFGNIDASECKEDFEFGKDGKPVFIQGPYDSESKIKNIMLKTNQYIEAVEQNDN